MSLSLLNMSPDSSASLSLIFSRWAASRKLLWSLVKAVTCTTGGEYRKIKADKKENPS